MGALRIDINTEFVADPLDDIGREHNHTGTKALGLQFFLIGLAPVAEGLDSHASIIGNLLSGHCFHCSMGLEALNGLNSGTLRVGWRLFSVTQIAQIYFSKMKSRRSMCRTF